MAKHLEARFFQEYKEALEKSKTIPANCLK
jgi:hypothetical protein